MDDTKKQLSPVQEESGEKTQNESGTFFKLFRSKCSNREMVSMLYGSDTDSGAAAGSKPSPSFPAPEPAPEPLPGKMRSEEVNVLTKGLLIEGNVTSDTDLLIGGVIRGNVICHSDIELCGEIVGDIAGRNIRIKEGAVQGDVQAAECLSVEQSTVRGNLSARQARIDNRIEGNITVCGTLSLLAQADIQGDITAHALSVEEGAVLSGRVSIEQSAKPTTPENPPFKPGQPKELKPAAETATIAGPSGCGVAKTEHAQKAEHQPKSGSKPTALPAVFSGSDVMVVSGAVAEEPESKVSKAITIVAAVVGITFFGGLLLKALIVEAMRILNL